MLNVVWDGLLLSVESQYQKNCFVSCNFNHEGCSQSLKKCTFLTLQMIISCNLMNYPPWSLSFMIKNVPIWQFFLNLAHSISCSSTHNTHLHTLTGLRCLDFTSRTRQSWSDLKQIRRNSGTFWSMEKT